MPSTYEKIATTTLGSAAASITFSSVSSSYTDLRLVLSGVPIDTSGSYIGVRFNGDTASNYSYTWLYGAAATVNTDRGSSTYPVYLNYGDTAGDKPYLVEVDIFSYTGSTFKTFLATTSMDNNGTGTMQKTVACWRSTSAINEVTIFKAIGNNLNTGSTATLYGILKA